MEKVIETDDVWRTKRPGLHVLYPAHDQKVETRLDIIAVHGLMGNSFGTWTDQESQKMWLRDFLPADVPEARILTFGYDAALFGRSVLNLVDVANNLIAGILSVRDEQNPTRPLAFVGHSMGGLVIKQALLNASHTYPEICSATKAIVFLAVPHRGSGSASFGSVVANIVAIARPTQTQFLENLRADNEQLTNLSFEFSYLRHQHDIQILSVMEGERTKLSKFWRGSVWIVPKHSAQMGIGCSEQVFSISGGDHRNMCKFSRSDDPQYIQLSQAILRILQRHINSEMPPKESSIVNQQSSDREGLDCMHVLDTFDAIATKANISSPIGVTLTWILQDTKLNHWLTDEDARLLWVCGGPGCGKSVMAGFIIDFIQMSHPESTLCYFFCEKKMRNQDSNEAILRGLLHQLFTQKPELLKYAINCHQTVKEFWSRSRPLWETLVRSIKDENAGQVFLVIDGFDESDGLESSQLLKWILVELPRMRVKIMFTSRPDGDYFGLLKRSGFNKDGTKCLNRTLIISLGEDNYWNMIQKDVQTFIELKVTEVGEASGLDFETSAMIKAKVSKRAESTFLWAALIVQILESSASMSLASIDRVIEKLPESLEQAYHEILSQVDNDSRPMSLKMLKIIAAAHRSLTLNELQEAFAIQFRSRSKADLAKHFEPFLERTLRELGKNLITIHDGKIRFLHSTVRDFLLSERKKEKSDLWYDFSGSEAEATMASICNTYVLLSDFKDKPLIVEDYIHGEKEQSIIQRYKSLHPFLTYAALNWADHFRTFEAFASSESIDQAMRLSNVASNTYRTWFSIYCGAQPKSFGYPQGLSSCHIAAFNGHTTVLSRLIEKRINTELLDNAGWSPLHWACYGGHVSTVRQLLEAGAVPVDQSTTSWPGALQLAVSGGHLEIVQLLLEVMTQQAGSGKPIPSDVATLAIQTLSKGHMMWSEAEMCRKVTDVLLAYAKKSEASRTALEKAEKLQTERALLKKSLHSSARRGDTEDVRAILNAGIKIQNNNNFLEAAVRSGNLALVKLLAEAGAPVNVAAGPGPKPDGDYTALQAATERGDVEMVKYLLEIGADVNAMPSYHCGMTALQGAVSSGNQDIVSLLLEAHADVHADPAPWMGVTAMQAAARGGHLAIAKQLEEAGASVNEPAGWRGNTTLQWACQKGHTEFVKWLLQFEITLEALNEAPHRQQTAWQLAKGKDEIRELLKAAGARCVE